MTRVAWFATVVFATLVGLALLWRFGTLIVLFLLSLAIAAALRPVVQAASSGKLSRRAGLTLVYVLLVAVILAGVSLMLPPLAKDIQQATNDLLTGYEKARIEWPQSGTLFQQSLAGQLPPSEDIYAALTDTEGVQALEGIFGAAGDFLSMLGYFLMAVLLSLYWSADKFRFERLAFSFLPEAAQAKALHAWRAVETGVGGFLRRTVIESLALFLGLGFCYWALGLRVPVLLAVWAVIAGLIPWFGVPIMLLPAIPIWMGVSPAVGFLFILLTLVVLIVVRGMLRSRLYQPPLHNSMVTLLFILAMAKGPGLIGVLFAPLLALALRILFEDLDPIPAGRFSPDIVQKANNIQRRLNALRAKREAGESPEARLLLDRLNRLARSTRKYLGGY